MLIPNDNRLTAKDKLFLVNALTAFEKATATETLTLSSEPLVIEGKYYAGILLGDNNTFIAELKHTLRPSTLGSALAALKRLPRPAILVSNYISPQLAETLKNLGVPFLDAAGNSYLRSSDTFIYIVARKETTKSQSRPIRAFRAKGLKVIFALLCLPDLIKAPYCKIATNSVVALGTVTNVLKDLEQLGYLYRSKKNGLVWEILIN